jgi:hypothetical protein
MMFMQSSTVLSQSSGSTADTHAMSADLRSFLIDLKCLSYPQDNIANLFKV